MTSKTRTFASALLLTAVALLPAAPQAEAATITLFDGTNTVMIDDQSGLDQNALLGWVSFTGTIGSWTFTVASGLTKPQQGTAQNASMTLNVTAQSSVGGTLTATFEDTGFGPSGTTGNASLAGGFAPGSVSYSVLQDTTVLASTPLLSGTYATQFLPLTLATGAAAYSLTQQVTISQSAGLQTTSLTAFLSVPDGGLTLSMLGSCLLAIGLLRRRFGLR